MEASSPHQPGSGCKLAGDDTSAICQQLRSVIGHKVTADLGNGVRLQSCSCEKTTGTFVRIGPLQLIKNGILILKLATDQEGRLQGEYRPGMTME